MEKEQELEKLKNQREKQITGVFWFGLEIIFIFGIPAALGAFIGKKLLGGGTWLFVILVFTFILSWVIMGVRYTALNKKMKKLDDRIKELQNEDKN